MSLDIPRWTGEREGDLVQLGWSSSEEQYDCSRIRRSRASVLDHGVWVGYSPDRRWVSRHVVRERKRNASNAIVATFSLKRLIYDLSVLNLYLNPSTEKMV